LFVETQGEFKSALNQTKFDLIISDFSLPSYDGAAALIASLKSQPETPFIFYFREPSAKNAPWNFLNKARPIAS
jgi:DNA-binding NtrC family response regulator